MAKERILITVKTYPTLSKKHTELVCTAGFREDGTWIRIYPFPFRLLDDNKKYRKYQWIELDLEKNPKDQRPESYRPINIDDVSLQESLPSSDGWRARKILILEQNEVYKNLNSIISGAHNNEFSLVIFKPRKFLDFVIKADDRDWQLDKKEVIEASLKQGDLFSDGNDTEFKIMPKLPYKFSYRFEDDNGKESQLMIEDWEIGQLYWNCLSECGSEKRAIEKVKEKYWHEFVFKKDLHLFLGTTAKWHKFAPNPYVIG